MTATRQLDRGSQNPRMQCSVCGRWMRLHGRDAAGIAFQRFYAACEDESGIIHGHVADVCDRCCKQRCPYRTSK